MQIKSSSYGSLNITYVNIWIWMWPNILWFPRCLNLFFFLSFLISNVLMMWGKIRRRNMSISFLLLHLHILVDLSFMAGVWENNIYTSCQSCLLHTCRTAKICYCSAFFFPAHSFRVGVFLHYTDVVRLKLSLVLEFFREQYELEVVTFILVGWHFAFTYSL